MAHLVSSDKQLLLRAGEKLGLKPAWLQHKPLKDPDSGKVIEAWHWDLRGSYLTLGLRLAGPRQ